MIGCLDLIAFAACSSTAILSDDDFTHDSTDYTVSGLYVEANGNFSFSVDTTITTETAALTLVVGSTSLVLADATTRGTLGRIWASSGVSLTVGTAINVKLTAPAQAQTEIWSATLTPGDLGDGVIGCLDLIAFAACSSTAILSDDDFTHDSTDYTVSGLFVEANGNFSFSVDTTITTETAALTLVVGSTSLVLADATTRGTLGRIWASSGVSLTVGTAINVKLTAAASTNTAPTVANTIPNQTATAGTAFSYAFLANTFADTDPGDTLTYTATQSDDTALPSWLSFAAATRTFSGTPTAADVGTVSVKVTASDGHGGSVSDTFDIVVSAAAGVTVSKSALTVTEEDTTGNTYTVVLDTRPTANVTVTVAGHGGTDVTLTPTSLTFTTTTWGTAQTVTVKAGDDADTANDTVTLTHSAASTDTGYEGISIDGVAVTVTDNDTAPATGAPTITGTAQVGQTLTAVTTGIMDADGLTSPTYTYQWIRVDGTDEADIASANSSTYILVDADLGTTLKVRVTFADDLGHTETLTSAATATVGAAATGPDGDRCGGHVNAGLGHHLLPRGRGHRIHRDVQRPGDGDRHTEVRVQAGRGDAAGRVRERLGQRGVGVRPDGAGRRGRSQRHLVECDRARPRRRDHHADGRDDGRAPDPRRAGAAGGAPGGRRPADAGLGVGAGAGAGAGLRRAARSGLDAGAGRVYGDGDGRSHRHAPGGVGGVDLRHLGDADTGRGAGGGRDGDAGVRAAGVEPGAGRGGQRCAGVQRPEGQRRGGQHRADGRADLTGTAQVGQTLTASTTGIADADGLTSPTYTYQWIRVNGTEADIAGENSSTYILVDADLGTTLKVRVTFADDLGHTETLTSAATATVVAAATAALGQVLGVGVAPGNAHLVVTWTAVDTATGYTVQWMSGSQGYNTGDRQATVTSGSPTRYTIPSLTNGTAYTVRVIATRTGADDGPPSAEMTGTPRVPNTAATGAPTITGTAQVGETLTASTTGIADANGLTSPTYTYQWIRVDGTDEADIASANSSTYPGRRRPGHDPQGAGDLRDDLGHTETLTSAATATVGAVATGPTVTDVAVTSTPASGTTYYLAGEVIEFTVTFSAPVTVTATPKFAFRLGAATRQAAYASGSDSAALVFARTVQAGEVDRNGISWNAIALALDGGTITQTGATTAARLTHAAQAPLEGHRVDAAPPMQVSASVQGLALVLVYDEPLDPASMPAPGAYTVTATVGATATHPAVSEVSIYGIWVTLTLDAAPAAGATVTLAYAPPASNPVQDEAGNDAPAFSGQKVNGAAGNTAPTGAPTITGTAQVGQTLTASTTGIADADGLTSPTYTYQWIRVNGTEADIAGENSSTYILVDADLGTTLKVRVTFADDLGHTETLTSAATATVVAAATAALGQVLGVGVAPGNAHLVVTWTAVDTATGYTVQWMSGSQGYTTGDRQATVTSGSPTRYTIPSLTNGTAYTVRVIATRTGVTDGPPSAEMTGTPRVPPPPPPPPVTDLAQVLGVGVAPGNAHLVVTWTAVDTATGYTVQWMSGSQGYTTGDRQATVTSGSPTRYTIPSLTNGTAYTVRVIATRTGVTDGPPSAEMTGTPRVPNTAATGAPTITGTAQVGETLTASTTGIADANGLTSPTYTYQWIRVDGTEADIASANSSTYILVDADLGTTLKVRVTFADDLGHTETLTSAATATVGAAATAPTVTDVAVTSTPASGTTYYLAGEVIEFTVTFSAPVTVTATPKFAFRLGAATRQAAYASGSDSAALVFARTVQAGEVDRNGISWNAIALALDGGTITQTGATTAARLTHAAQAPLEGHRVDAAPPMQVSASVQGLALVLVYDEPLDPASMPATGAYTVTATVGATATNPAVSEVSIYGIWVTLTLDAAPAAGATVTLAYAPPASNPVQDEAGNDAPAFSGQSVRLGPPPPPPDLAQVLGVGVAPGNAQLVVTWTAVDTATGYTVQWMSGSQGYTTGDRQATVTSGSTTRYTIPSLTNGTAYTVRVIATRTGVTDGPPSAEMTGTPRVPPPPPPPVTDLAQVLGVGVAPGNAQLVVTWTAVDTATGYTVQWMSGSEGYNTGDRQAPVTSGSTTRYTIPSLINGTAYTVRVIATRTGVTDGPPSAEVTATPVTTPGAPQDLRGEPGDAQVTLTWAAPASDGGSAILRYEYAVDDSGTWIDAGGDLEETVRDLTSGQSYAVAVRAVTAAGAGPATTVTSVPADPRPQAWLARFGRTATDHVVDAVSSRWHGGPQASHLTLGGPQAEALLGWTGLGGQAARDTAADRGDSVRTERASPRLLAPSGGAWPGVGGTGPGMTVAVTHRTTAPGGLGGVDRDAGAPLRGRAAPRALLDAWGLPDPRALTDLRAALMGSSFVYAGAQDDDGQARTPGWLGAWSAWGRGAASWFSGADGGASLEGEVATAMLGFDSRWGRWRAGVVASHSRGQGTYTPPTAPGGAVASTLTALHPYVGYDVNARTSVWGVVGYGVGEVSLTPARATTARETDLTNTMAAVGGRAALSVRSGRAGRFELALRSDARLTNTAADAVAGLVGATERTGLVRMMLEGAGVVPLALGGVLTPTVEAGLRYDTGDAETGAGLEVGGGLGYAARRLSVTVNARGLLAHQDTAYEEWGFSGAMTYTPSADGRGLSMRLGSGWGATHSGVESLWSRQDAAALVRHAPVDAAQAYQLEVRYGLDGRQGRARWAPYLGVASGGGSRQALRLGVTLTAGRRLDAGLELGQRQGAPGADPEHAAQLRATLRW